MKRAVCTLFLCLAAASSAAPWPPARPQLFEIGGELDLRVDSDIALGGRFELDLVVETTGQPTIRRLSVFVPDFVLVSEAFFGLLEERTPFLCNEGTTVAPIPGHLDASGALSFASSAARIVLSSRKTREAGGGCDDLGPVHLLDAENNAPLVGRHDPAGNRFQLAGSFVADVDGRSVPVSLRLDGSYGNRPPVARIASQGPEVDFSQGGCPGAEANSPPVEANAPGGLELAFRSLSWDADGPYAGADLTEAYWETLDGGVPRVLGLGETVGATHFGLGGPHTVALTVFDRAGAGAVASCSFHVADTRPPLLTPPGWLWTPCSVPTGARPADVPALAAWLDSVGVSDVADPAPIRLAPRVGGLEVTAATVLPVAAWTPVDFAARDASGNVGTTWDWVWVSARPELVVSWRTPASGSLAGTGGWVPVESGLETPGCGYASVALVALRSNGPEPIGDLVSGAEVGTPDTTFKVKAVPVPKPGGGFTPRLFEFEYRTTGLDGTVTTVVLPLWVWVS